MVILRTRDKITDFLMILAWASPFKVTKNVGSTLVRCCIQWTNIDSTSCVCWDMIEIQIIEQYNCITCIKTIILVMFVVSILNKGRTVNNKKIGNEEKKKM